MPKKNRLSRRRYAQRRIKIIRLFKKRLLHPPSDDISSWRGAEVMEYRAQRAVMRRELWRLIRECELRSNLLDYPVFCVRARAVLRDLSLYAPRLRSQAEITHVPTTWVKEWRELTRPTDFPNKN